MKLDNNLSKILIIRRDNVGDLVCTTPAIAALRKKFSTAKIGVLVNSYNCDILRNNPNVDHVFVYTKSKHASNIYSRCKVLGERVWLLIKLRFWNPDVTILAKSSYDKHGLFFARLIGARAVIGFCPDYTVRSWQLPQIKLEAPKPEEVHEVEAVNLLLSPLGVCDALGPLQLYPDSAVVQSLSQRLPTHHKLIALHISAREPERRWGIENFSSLLKYIFSTYRNTHVILLWSPGLPDDPKHPGDDLAAEELVKRNHGDRLTPIHTKTLVDLVATLSLVDVFVGADGGAMHVAVGLGIKTLALFENVPSKLNHWYPWSVECSVLHSDSALEKDVSKIDQLLVQQSLAKLLK